MNNLDVAGRIRELCNARSWTFYRLAKESGITYSTLNTLLNRNNIPSIPTLSRICDGFGITLAQFFSDEDALYILTKEQKAHMKLWNQLDERGRELSSAYIQALVDRQGREKEVKK